MDSKMRRLAILSSVAVIALITLLVLILNPSDRGNRGGTSQPSATTEAANNGASAVAAGNTVSSVNGQVGNDLSAFLNDNTFFDQEINPTLLQAKDSAKRLSLVITSVEKDLRIQVVNGLGEIVTGESFFVNIESVGKYKDLDQDGIIYVAGLKAGDLNVSLVPIEGYIVSENPTKIMVKDKVEYVAISDISLLIKTEADIDALVEDTADGNVDSDKTVNNSLMFGTGTALNGIDVSKYQKEIDWAKVAEAGVQFAIIRCGYRGSKTGTLVEDPYFQANIRGAQAAGVPVGVYFFTQATNEVEAVEEASVVISLINEYKLDLPVFIDTEGAGGKGRADDLNVETRTLVCDAFCRTITNAGYSAGVYASKNWLNNRLDVTRLENYSTWLAEYRSAPTYKGKYIMWQHSSKGSVDGINGNVDLDIFYRQ